MNLLDPFTGTLYLPDKAFGSRDTTVLLPDGRPVASIQWHTWSARFEVYDATGGLVATCQPKGFLRRRYTVRTRDGRLVVELIPGTWRPFNGAELRLVGNRTLTIRQQSMWSDRKFEFYAGERLVGRILPTTGAFSFRPDSYSFELLHPTLSALEAISLAQALRVAVRSQRASSEGAA